MTTKSMIIQPVTVPPKNHVIEVAREGVLWFDHATKTTAKHAIKTLLDTAPRIVLAGAAIAFLSVMVLLIIVYLPGEPILHAIAVLGGALGWHAILSGVVKQDMGLFGFLGSCLLVPVTAVAVAAIALKLPSSAYYSVTFYALLQGLSIPLGALIAVKLCEFMMSGILGAFGVNNPRNPGQAMPADYIVPQSALMKGLKAKLAQLSLNDELKLTFSLLGLLCVAMLVGLLMMFVYSSPDMTLTSVVVALGLTCITTLTLALWLLYRTVIQRTAIEKMLLLDRGTARAEYVAARRADRTFDRFKVTCYRKTLIPRMWVLHQWLCEDTLEADAGWYETEYEAYRAAERYLAQWQRKALLKEYPYLAQTWRKTHYILTRELKINVRRQVVESLGVAYVLYEPLTDAQSNALLSALEQGISQSYDDMLRPVVWVGHVGIRV